MLDTSYMYLESWTHDRLREMRRVAASEAQLRDLHPRQPWMHRLAGQLGQTLVSLGCHLQRYGSTQAQPSH